MSDLTPTPTTTERTPAMTDSAQFRDADTGVWWEVSDAIRAALEGDPATGDNFPDLLADAWDEGADFAVRHPGMGAEYTRTANQYRLNTEGA